MAQTVAAYFRHSCSGAGFVDVPPYGCRMFFNYRTFLVLHSLQSDIERFNDGYFPAAGTVLIGFLVNQAVIFVRDHGATNTDPTVLQVYMRREEMARRAAISTEVPWIWARNRSISVLSRNRTSLRTVWGS